jgi:hypothetical protein
LPITKTKASAVPRMGKGQRPSLFELTPEWKELRRAIDKGLRSESAPGKNDADALTMTITAAELRAMGLTWVRSIERVIKTYIRDTGKPYTVKVFKHAGSDLFVIEGEKAKRRRRRPA